MNRPTKNFFYGNGNREEIFGGVGQGKNILVSLMLPKVSQMNAVHLCNHV